MGLFNNTKQSDVKFGIFPGFQIADWNATVPNALKNPVVASIVSLISNSIASMPIKVYMAGPNGTQSGSFTAESALLSGKPNTFQTPYLFVKTIVSNVVIHGEAFLFKVYLKDKLSQLIPVNPDNVTVELKKGIKTYKIDGEKGTYTDNEIIHILFSTQDGVSGYPQIKQHADVISHDNVLRKYSKKYFSQSANPSMYLTASSAVSDTDITRLKDGFSSEYTSVENVGKVPVIPDTFKLNTLSSNAKDADLVESLRYSLENVARCWNVPPSKIGSKDGANYSSLEAENIAFLQNCLHPIVQCIESALDTYLFFGQPFYVKFNVNSVLRSTTLDRYNAYRLATGGNPFMTQNEVRALEEMNPMTDGDKLLVTTTLTDGSTKQ